MMHILTYATDTDNQGFQNFVQSVKENTAIKENDCINLGLQKHWNGWLDKFRAVRRYLSCVYDDEDILFVDGYDSVFVRSTQDIANMLVHKIPHNAQMVVGAETNCFPEADRASRYNKADSPYKYLNSGCYYAEAGYLKYMLDDMGIHRLPTDYNDQQLMTDWFLNHQHTGDIVLDYDANIFMNLYNCESDLTFEDGRAYNKVTRSFPCIIHGNGKSDMTPTLNFLAERRKSKKE